MPREKPLMEIENTDLSPSKLFQIEREVTVEVLIADSEGREPFKTPIYIGDGELVRTTDGKVRYIADSF